MGDEIAEELFKDKIPIVYKYLIKKGCTSNDAEDIVQNTLYKAMLYIDSLNQDNISAWLFRVALNEYYDLCRKRKRVSTFSFDDNEIADILLVDNTCPEEKVISNENKEKINYTLSQLNETYKNLLLLKFSMGLSYKEISKLLDIGEDTAKTYVYRAKLQFKKLWEVDLYE